MTWAYTKARCRRVTTCIYGPAAMPPCSWCQKDTDLTGKSCLNCNRAICRSCAKKYRRLCGGEICRGLRA